jgi:hypothetical protein
MAVYRGDSATVIKNCSSSFDVGFNHIFLLLNIIVQRIQPLNYKIIENYFWQHIFNDTCFFSWVNFNSFTPQKQIDRRQQKYYSLTKHFGHGIMNPVFHYLQLQWHIVAKALVAQFSHYNRKFRQFQFFSNFISQRPSIPFMNAYKYFMLKSLRST